MANTQLIKFAILETRRKEKREREWNWVYADRKEERKTIFLLRLEKAIF